MMDNTRIRISEVHLGKFPDPVEFQICKVKFKTEVYSKSADPQLTMHRIKDIGMAKSIDYDVLDAVSVQEQRAQTYDGF